MPNGQIFSSTPANPANIAGAANAQYLLLDGIEAANPGIWMPWSKNGFSRGSFEVTNASATPMNATIKLQISNAKYIPANILRIGIAGSPTDGDVLTVKVACPGLFAGALAAVTYTVVGSMTIDQVCTALAAAIQTKIDLAANTLIQTQDANNAAGSLLATAVLASDAVDVSWQYPLPPISIAVEASGGAGTTITVAPHDDGTGFTVPNCSVTAVGNVVFDNPASWVRANCTAYTAGELSAIVQAVSP